MQDLALHYYENVCVRALERDKTTPLSRHVGESLSQRARRVLSACCVRVGALSSDNTLSGRVR